MASAASISSTRSRIFSPGVPTNSARRLANPTVNFPVTSLRRIRAGPLVARAADHGRSWRSLRFRAACRPVQPGRRQFQPAHRPGLEPHLPRWVLRAGYGIFFDRYVLADLAQRRRNERLSGLRAGGGRRARRQIFLRPRRAGRWLLRRRGSRRPSFSPTRAWLLPTASRRAPARNINWPNIFRCAPIICLCAA